MRKLDKFDVLYLGVIKELGGKIPESIIHECMEESQQHMETVEHYWKKDDWKNFQIAIKNWRGFWLKKLKKEKT